MYAVFALCSADRSIYLYLHAQRLPWTALTDAIPSTLLVRHSNRELDAFFLMGVVALIMADKAWWDRFQELEAMMDDDSGGPGRTERQYIQDIMGDKFRVRPFTTNPELRS